MNRHSVDDAIANIPDGWWLQGLEEIRTPVIYAGDKHKPTGRWETRLQLADGGGRLTRGDGGSAAEAIFAASAAVDADPTWPRPRE